MVNLGRVGLVFCGEYEAKEYKLNSIVSFEKKLYCSLTNGINPTDTEHWSEFLSEVGTKKEELDALKREIREEMKEKIVPFETFVHLLMANKQQMFLDVSQYWNGKKDINTPPCREGTRVLFVSNSNNIKDSYIGLFSENKLIWEQNPDYIGLKVNYVSDTRISIETKNFEPHYGYVAYSQNIGEGEPKIDRYSYFNLVTKMVKALVQTTYKKRIAFKDAAYFRLPKEYFQDEDKVIVICSGNFYLWNGSNSICSGSYFRDSHYYYELIPKRKGNFSLYFTEDDRDKIEYGEHIKKKFKDLEKQHLTRHIL